MGKSKKAIVGFKYYLGLHAVLGVKPIDRLIRWYADGKILYNTPESSGVTTINSPKFFSAGEVPDGMVGSIRLHLNGTPTFDSYLQAQYPVDSTLVPRFDKWAHVVFFSGSELTDPTLQAEGELDDGGVSNGGFDSVVDLTTIFSIEEIDSGQVTVEAGYSRTKSGTPVQLTVNLELKANNATDGTGINIGSTSEVDFQGNSGADTASVTASLTIPSGARSLIHNSSYSSSVGVIEGNNYYRIFGPDSVGRPFYIGNQPRPRQIEAIGERYTTTCPYANNTISYTDFAGNTVQDFNPISMYWELFIKDDASRYGTTFSTAADTIFTEGLAIYAYGVPPKREDLENEISRYVNGRIYTDRGTGIREIKLLRDDYTVGSLVTIGEDDIIGDPQLTLPNRAAAFNTFDVSFRDRTKDYEIAFFTVYDEAHVAAFGTRRSIEPLEYPWVTSREKALDLARRDVRAQTGAGVFGSVRVSGLRTDLNEGDAVVIDLPSWGFSGSVCRIDKIAERGPRDNSVTISFFEDPHDIEVSPVVTDDLPEGVTFETPVAATYEVAIEAPYYFAHQFSDIDAILEDNEGFGGLLSAAARPNALYLGYDIHVDAGSGFVEEGFIAFTPGGELTSDVARTATQIATTPLTGLVSGGLILVGSEWMRVNSFVQGATWLVNVGRGALDTVPIAHVSGETVVSQINAGTDEIEYSDGDSIDVKHTPIVSGQELALADATALPVTFDSRAIRPYPPAQYQIDASYDDQTGAGPFTATWVSRNRLLQVDDNYAEDHTDAAILAEAGTTYYARAEALDVDENSLGFFIETDIGDVATYDFDVSSAPSGTYYVDLSVATLRDGYESWTRPTIRVALTGSFAAGGNEKFDDDPATNDTFSDGTTNDTFDDTE